MGVNKREPHKKALGYKTNKKEKFERWIIMKKNLKKLSSLVLAFVLMLSLSVPVFAADVSAKEAKAIAVDYFDVKQSEVKFLEVRKDYDDGRSVYEIEFCKPYSVKYSCEVVVSSGRVRDAEREAVRGLGDKIELFFEILIWSIFKR